MIDSEVQRLRRLRGSALRLRAVARALGDNKWSRNDALLNAGRCAAWRVARTVSGRLRAHPNVRYQRDPGVATLLRNSIAAAATSLAASSRRRALTEYGTQLACLMRELNDARALTWATDLSDAFGRSQREVRGLIDAVYRETHYGREVVPRDTRRSAAVAEPSSFLTI